MGLTCQHVATACRPLQQTREKRQITWRARRPDNINNLAVPNLTPATAIGDLFVSTIVRVMGLYDKWREKKKERERQSDKRWKRCREDGEHNKLLKRIPLTRTTLLVEYLYRYNKGGSDQTETPLNKS
ncbi:hypothetical protein ElyMa_002770500 [Elysia marginata]|uniref:Uncharacterized protein n=1 Tax=Elysia marginata TaxID=1093978 RepID=A0AAV4HLC9_9GAST|nr:hypothetical protein ElyMa_002770500 [Elysia marginata]